MIAATVALAPWPQTMTGRLTGSDVGRNGPGGGVVGGMVHRHCGAMPGQHLCCRYADFPGSRR
jgi:hypothetical protein